MTRTPLLSVIVPCFHVERYLPDLVLSLGANDRDDIEFVFVEDRSTRDRTYAALLDLSRRLAHARVIRHPHNAGLATARNTGTDAARGRWLTYLDGDDWLAPGYLPALAARAQVLDVDFVRVDHVQVTGVRREVRRAPEGRRDVALDPRSSILPVGDTTMVDYPYAWAGIYHRRLRDRGLLHFPDGLRTAEDRPWIWALHRRAEAYAVTALHGVFYRRGLPGSLTQIGDVRQLDFFRAFDLVLADLAGDRDAERLRPKAVRDYCTVIAHHLLDRDRFERRVYAALRNRAAALLGSLSRDDLHRALTGMGADRVRELRRLHGGLKDVAA